VASSEPRWHAEAVEDAREARDWYAERSALAARGFLLELSDAIEAVAEAPERWPIGRAQTRRYVFPRRYPYTLVYRYQDGLIAIVAVAHHKRHPEYWLHR
jgi:plasmid stabilization system protein ParE